MRCRWIVSALGLTACLDVGRVITLPPEIGAREALLVPPPGDAAPVLPIFGSGDRQPFTLTAPWSEPLDLLAYDCPLKTFGIDGVLEGPRETPSPAPSSWWRLSTDARWILSTEPLTDRPSVPNYPQAPSECWGFEEATVEDRVEFEVPIAAVALLDDTHLLVGDHAGGTVLYEVGATLRPVATFAEVSLVALWADPPRRRAYWLAADGGAGVFEPAGSTWESRRLSEPAPGFGACVIRELSGDLIPDGELALSGVADDDHVELLALGRCGSVAYFNSRQGSWRPVATGAVTQERDLARRVGAGVTKPGEWWVFGLDAFGLRRYVDLDQGTGAAAPERFDSGAEATVTALVPAPSGRLYLGNREGEVYEWMEGRAHLLTQVPDKVLRLYPFRGGVIIAGENASSVFQHQPLEPNGLCSDFTEVPTLAGVQRLHHLVELSDGRVTAVGVRGGAPEPGIYSQIVLHRPRSPRSWSCHPPGTDFP